MAAAMANQTPGDFAVVFTGQITEADLVKFVLQEAGIRCWLENQQMGTALPGIVSPTGAGVRVLVAPGDEAKAKAEIKRSQQDETTEE
ncbi:MAG: putative signal transducing protein [Planctomycetota bacterium]